jgi:hypothetical protein
MSSRLRYLSASFVNPGGARRAAAGRGCEEGPAVASEEAFWRYSTI